MAAARSANRIACKVGRVGAEGWEERKRSRIEVKEPVCYGARTQEE